MQGILLINKPKDWTSFDVVNYVRRIVAHSEGKKPKNCKVGHTGTLDPLATGLLVLLVGKEYTRRAGELTKLDKTYEVTMKLGETSTTADNEGEKSFVSDSRPSLTEVTEALQTFTGDIIQTPPIYSAIKVNGQRAYKLARAGTEVVLEARPARIASTSLTAYEYPFVRFTSDVSSGTYIRSLVVDVGEALGTGAYMSDLSRTRVGKFKVEDSSEVKGLNSESISRNLLTIE